ncbi:RNA-directed DNA polymerase, eukaryota, reverse transcriptase zinc-binding domain protein [Tanacetum coccineum]
MVLTLFCDDYVKLKRRFSNVNLDSIKYKDTICELTKANKQNNEDCTNTELNVENVEELDNNISDIKECNSDAGMVSGSNCANCYVNTSKDDCCTNDRDNANDMKRIRAEGREVVIFDEESVMKGSRKWSLTLCGHFVGFKMTYSELRYILVRMSWMVNNKPLMVHKWNLDVIIDKSDPKVLPCWIKLYNIPLEAWTIKGINAIASGLGKPLIMDKTTTKMCRGGTVFGHTVSTCGLKSGNENDVAKGNGIKGNEKTKDGFKRVRNGTKTIQPEWVMGKAEENLKRISKENVEELRRSANKISILEEIHDHEDPEKQMLINKEIENKFVMNQRQPTIKDSRKWKSDMFKYFKEQWEAKWMNECPDEKDVFDEVT